MTQFLKEKDDGGRIHLKSRFVRESLVDKEVAAKAIAIDEVAIMPKLNLISVGGKLIDRGRETVYPLMDELVKAKKLHQIGIGVTGGARYRHAMAIGMDFGLPVGGLAMIVGANEEQNALMLYTILAKNGAVRVPKDHYCDLPHYLEAGMIPIMTFNPPHHYWEKPPRKGFLPENGADFGGYMTAEYMGAQSMIFIKDQDGLYDKDPNKHSDAKFIDKISAQELLKSDQDELIIDYTVVEMISRAHHVKQVQIINGLKPELLLKALAGEHVGTIIYKEEK